MVTIQKRTAIYFHDIPALVMMVQRLIKTHAAPSILFLGVFEIAHLDGNTLGVLQKHKAENGYQ